MTAAGRDDAPLIEHIGDAASRGDSLGAKCVDGRCELGRAPVRVRLDGCDAGRVVAVVESLRAVGISEALDFRMALLTGDGDSRLRLRQRGLGSGRYEGALFLGERR